MAEKIKFVTDLEELDRRSDELDTRKENNLIKSTVLDLKYAIRENNLLGVSAPQIGIYKRIIVLNFNGDFRTFVNPMITKCEGLSFNKETIPNIPYKTFLVPRYNNISLMFITPTGKLQSCNLLGVASHIMQQQVDMLEGVFPSDVGFEIDEDFENASEEEREKVMQLFLDSLDLKREELEKEINEDDDLKKMRDGINFLQSVARGETKIETVVEEKKEEKEDEPDNS